MIQSWSTNEQFLVGKVYEYIRGVKPTVSWCSVIWNPAMPPKMSFILWLAKKNRLLTLDKIAFLNKGSLCLYVKMRPSQMLIYSFLAGNLSKFGFTFVIWLLSVGVSLLYSALLTL